MGSNSEMEKSAKEKKRTVVSLAPIAKPLAGKKLCKRTLKLVRIAAENKCLKRGVKEVVKSIRRGNKGFCVIAGNISPIDVITHVPIFWEEVEIPSIYVPSKEVWGGDHRSEEAVIYNFVKHPFCDVVKIFQDLVNAGSTKRSTYCVLVLTKPTKGELGQEEQKKLKADYDEVTFDVQELAISLF